MENLMFAVDDYMILGLNAIIASLAIIEIKKDGKLKGFSIRMLFMVAVQIFQYALAKLSVNNIFIFHFCIPIDFALLAMVFHEWEQEYKELYKYSSIILWLVIVLDCGMSSFRAIPINSLVLSSLTFTVFSTRALYVSETKRIGTIAFGLVIYYSHSSAIFYLYKLTDLMMPMVYHDFVIMASLGIFIYGYMNGRE
ncbi:MAG: hypothetical protein IPK06_04830 [Ignavibacteriae bacterium]|nr:hypothetical protein [Ignavibacteriota bacterium]